MRSLDELQHMNEAAEKEHEDRLEAAARALTAIPWESLTERTQEHYRNRARKVLNAYNGVFPRKAR